MNESHGTLVEFVGGPLCGATRIMQGSPEGFSLHYGEQEVMYAWRRIDGQRVVRDDGLAPFDFISSHALLDAEWPIR